MTWMTRSRGRRRTRTHWSTWSWKAWRASRGAWSIRWPIRCSRLRPVLWFANLFLLPAPFPRSVPRCRAQGQADAGAGAPALITHPDSWRPGLRSSASLCQTAESAGWFWTVLNPSVCDTSSTLTSPTICFLLWLGTLLFLRNLPAQRLVASFMSRRRDAAQRGLRPPGSPANRPTLDWWDSKGQRACPTTSSPSCSSVAIWEEKSRHKTRSGSVKPAGNIKDPRKTSRKTPTSASPRFMSPRFRDRLEHRFSEVAPEQVVRS